MNQKITLSELKSILKIKENPSVIKLAKGIFLDDIETIFNDEATAGGISTKKYGNKWFMLPKGKAIFKTFDEYAEDVRNHRIANELICKELADMMHIRCAEYELATKDGETGVVTYDIKRPDEFMLSGYEMCVIKKIGSANKFESYLKAIKEYEKAGFTFNKQKIVTDLYKLMVFDCLTMQTDRHMNNIFVVFNKKNKTMKMSPLIDNEFAFNIDNARFALNSSQDEILEDEIEEDLKYIVKQITVYDTVSKKSLVHENIKQIVDVAKLNPKLDAILKHMINNFDINSAIEKINKKDEKYLKNCEKVIKKLILEEYNKKDRRIFKAMYDPILNN